MSWPFFTACVLSAFFSGVSGAAKSRVKRNYSEIEIRIKALKNAEVTVIGRAKGKTASYPLYAITTRQNRSGGTGQKNILISAGVHGDEPAGVYAVLEFLEKRSSPHLADFRFFVLPCVNPVGFELNEAGNVSGENLNRNFKKMAQPRRQSLSSPSWKNGIKNLYSQWICMKSLRTGPTRGFKPKTTL